MRQGGRSRGSELRFASLGCRMMCEEDERVEMTVINGKTGAYHGYCMNALTDIWSGDRRGTPNLGRDGSKDGSRGLCLRGAGSWVALAAHRLRAAQVAAPGPLTRQATAPHPYQLARAWQER